MSLYEGLALLAYIAQSNFTPQVARHLSRTIFVFIMSMTISDRGLLPEHRAAQIYSVAIVRSRLVNGNSKFGKPFDDAGAADLECEGRYRPSMSNSHILGSYDTLGQSVQY